MQLLLCRKSGHKVRNWTNGKSQDKGSGKAGGPNEAPKKNHFSTLALGLSKRFLSTW